MAEANPQVESSQVVKKETPELNPTPVVDEKMKLQLKLKDIMSCVVCKEVRRSSIYQCKYGHLMCAGCFGDVLSESKIQNEVATCPECQSTISKETCSQNIAVEKAISELPRTCMFCTMYIPPENYLQHQAVECQKRPVTCSNKIIGCNWKGPLDQQTEHEQQCQQLSADGNQILEALEAIDKQVQRDYSISACVFDLLSSETFAFFDLQFKHIETKEKKKFFESSKFYVFHNSFVMHGYLQEETSQFTYRLVSKNDYANKSLSFSYMVLKGPYSDMEIKPHLCHFSSKEQNTFHTLNLWVQGLKTYFSAERVNFRIFIFK